MGSFTETIQERKFLPTMPFKDDLPVSQSNPKNSTHLIGLRRRISSFSVRIQPLTTASSAWAFGKSTSMSSIGELAGGPLRRWWDWSWAWISSRKPAFAKDLEMNEQVTSMLGCPSKGSLRHMFYKVRSEIRKLFGSPTTLPTTQRLGKGRDL